MAGGSIGSNSVTPCTYISNGLMISPRASQFDSPHNITDSLSYFSNSDDLQTSYFISDTSYIDTFPAPTSISQSRPPASTIKTTVLAAPTFKQTEITSPALICISDRVADPTTQTNNETNSSDTDLIDIHLSTKKKYKPVALKVKPHIGTLPDKFRIIRTIIGDPLANLPTLPTNPPTFTPTGRYTQERKELFDKINSGFLLPAERDLLHYFMMVHNQGFAWETSERGHFREDFFPPVDIPVLPHKPWVQRNIPIPPGLYPELCRLVKDKIDAGVFEPSNSSYRSRWFCVVKKDGKSLRIVQSLEPLNAVTIAHSGVPPFTAQLAEQFAGRACNSMMDLFVGYDERALASSSRDLTTFQTPYGAMRLTTLPMGWTNSVPIFHDDVTHILQEEIPHVTQPYIDDVPVKGPATRYIQS